MHQPAYEMRISDWSSDVCSSDLSLRSFEPSFQNSARAIAFKHGAVRSHQDGRPAEAIRAREILIRIEATRVAARRGNFGAGIGGAQRAGLILRAVNAIREIAGAKRRNRTLDHAHVDRKSTRLNSSH